MALAGGSSATLVPAGGNDPRFALHSTVAESSIPEERLAAAKDIDPNIGQ